MAFLLGREVTSLLHERANGEPHGVDQREVIDQYPGFLSARMRIVPLVRAKPEMRRIPEMISCMLSKIEEAVFSFS